MPAGAQLFVDRFDVALPLGQDQAVPPSGDRRHNVVDDLDGARSIGHQVAVDRGDPAWR